MASSPEVGFFCGWWCKEWINHGGFRCRNGDLNNVLIESLLSLKVGYFFSIYFYHIWIGENEGQRCAIWVFPQIMLPQNHPFVHRVFHYFHHPFWGGYHPYFWFSTHIEQLSKDLKKSLTDWSKINGEGFGEGWWGFSNGTLRRRGCFFHQAHRFVTWGIFFWKNGEVPMNMFSCIPRLVSHLPNKEE